jgi:hypothetical protein
MRGGAPRGLPSVWFPDNGCSVKEFVLYFQPAGPTAHDPTPIVLCVGSHERCEEMQTTLLASPDFRAILARERHGKLQIAPSAGAARPVPPRIKYYHSRVGSISAVQPV